MVRICVRKVRLTLVSYTYFGVNVCCLANDNGAWLMACVLWQQIEYYIPWRLS